ncbi:acyltransferase family protein [Emcibacter sp.]|uniref:acyltransferase family protein n=1 Tax=Emcibacter sp. TaxID=1979954 RepID=UPI003A9181CE
MQDYNVSGTVGSLTYRRDIDGLRAIAILLVLFYHVGFSAVSGGFIGVDIFFVISGYLITSIINRHLDDGSFTFRNFFRRRIRRILPAFFTVAFASLLAGYFLFLASDYVKLSESIQSATLFLSNIYFWHEEVGYFTANIDEMPFLHVWSLSVEEQFYFIWPACLFLLVRFMPAGVILPTIILGTITSFGLGEWGARNVPNAAYYFLPTRGGELLLGALLAFIPKPGEGIRLPLAALQVMSSVGLLLMLVPGFVLNDRSLFPGVNAFIPCLGAALVIYAGNNPDTIGARILSFRPMVFIGLISYSLYLWHWPLLAFLNYFRFEQSLALALGVIGASILLSWLTWKFIEQPFRKGFGLPFGKLSLYYYVIPATVVFIAAHLQNSENDLRIEGELNRALLTNGWCHASGGNTDENRPFKPEYLTCQRGSENSDAEQALLFGDSTAGHFEPFLDKLGKAHNFSFHAISTNSCYPSAEVKETGLNGELCARFREYFVSSLAAKKYKYVFLSNRWSRNLTSDENYINELRDAIGYASQHAEKVFLLQQVPEFERDMAKCDNIRRVVSVTDCSMKSLDEHHLVNEFLDEAASRYPNVYVIRTTGFFVCDAGYYCSPYDRAGKMLYADSGHLNILAAKKMADWFLENRKNTLFSDRLR